MKCKDLKLIGETEAEIEAIKRYGDDVNLYGGQRDGFILAYNLYNRNTQDISDDYDFDDDEEDYYELEECDDCGKVDCVCHYIFNCTCSAWTNNGTHVADCICGGG